MFRSPDIENDAAGMARLPEVLRFVMVGGGATLLYGVLSLLLHEVWEIGAVPASFLAYCMAAIFSYVGHYFLTFQSRRSHGAASAAFSAVSLLGYGISVLSPWLLVTRMGLPMLAAVIFTSLMVPLVNFLLLKKMVFRA